METKQVTPGITATKSAANDASDADNKATPANANGTAPSGATGAPGNLAECKSNLGSTCVN